MKRSRDGAREREQRLHKQLKNLQQDWDTLVKRWKPNTIFETHQLFNNSPRDLMLYLQQTRSPSEAVEEILRERREARESGKLKGRRLFEPTDQMGFEGREEISSNVMSSPASSHDKNVGSSCAGSSISSPSDHEKADAEVAADGEYRVAFGVEGKRCGGDHEGVGIPSTAKWMPIVGWFAVVLIFALSIMSVVYTEVLGDDVEVILVPT